MNSYLLFKYLTTFLRDYIFIFLTATIFLFTISSKSLSEENVFTVNNVNVEGIVDTNFSREKYLNKAFIDSFDNLMKKIILSRDLNKIKDIKLKEIKNLISSFQILEESYSQDNYKLKIKISYNDIKVKKFLAKENISFSQPKNISSLFYPVLFINEEIQNLNENFFYKKWTEVTIKDETINFILPLEDLDDVTKIIKMKDNIEKLNVDDLVNKYDIKNYVFALMDYQNKKLNVHLKMNFNNNKISKNFFYTVQNINDEAKLEVIIKDLKFKIIDIWKEENLINLLMPLSIKLKFQHLNLNNLDELRKVLSKISTINKYTLEEFNTKYSYFKIYYYGDPKKLKSELSKFGYQLENVQGYWELYLNE